MKAILAFLLLSSSLLADSLCVRVVDQRPDQFGRLIRSEGFGSAVTLNKTKNGHWVAITARHVVGDSPASAISVGIDGWHPITEVYRLETDDDAAFLVFDYQGETKLNGTKVADDEPQNGEITFAGYSGGKKFEKFTGRLTGGVGIATADVRPRHGQSGGPVWDSHGRLIGVVTGYDDSGNLVYCPMGRCRRQCQRQWGFAWGIAIGCPPPLPPAYPPGPPPGPPVVVPAEPRPAPPVENEEPVAPAPLSLKGEKGDPGPPGPRGANGLMGMRGEQGPAGKDADESEVLRIKAELAALTAKLAALPKCNTTRLEARLTALEAALAKLSDQPSPALPSEGSQPGKIYYDVIDPQQ